MDADKHEVRRLLLTSPSYRDLASLCAALDQASLAEPWLAKDTVGKWTALARRGNETVACTFVLFHICVQWPKIRGQRNQQDAASELTEKLKASQFVAALSSLPKCLAASMAAFGK